MSVAKHRVLIVDDEQEVLDGLRRTLRHEGFDLVTITSPLEALRVLEEGGVDVLISDIDMPEMTGLELVLRARKEHPDVVRILLTGDSSVQSALTAINEGAVHKYLTKPWRSQELRETLRTTVLSLAALRQQAKSATFVDSEEARLRELEAEHPGISVMTRVDGAYLLNDMRVVERLHSLGEESAVFAAARWLPLSDDATYDLRAK